MERELCEHTLRNRGRDERPGGIVHKNGVHVGWQGRDPGRHRALTCCSAGHDRVHMHHVADRSGNRLLLAGRRHDHQCVHATGRGQCNGAPRHKRPARRLHKCLGQVGTKPLARSRCHDDRARAHAPLPTGRQTEPGRRAKIIFPDGFWMMLVTSTSCAASPTSERPPSTTTMVPSSR